jgi:hypothetical protein
MSTYLEMLKAKSQQKDPSHPPAKPSELTFEGSAGDPSSRFPPKSAEAEVASYEERAAICEFDGGLERGQAESLAALHAMPLPTGVNENERSVIIDAAARFLDQRRRRR